MLLTDKDTPYINRTRIYIGEMLLCHLDYNTSHAIRIMKPVMWGVYDLKYVWAKKKKKYIDYEVFVLLNVDNNTKKSMIPMLSKDKYYVDSYPYSFNNKDLIFAVFKLPKPLHRPFDKFLNGKFSEMYTPKELNKYGVGEMLNGEMNALHAILTKNIKFKPIFENKIAREYGQKIEVDVDSELDSFFVPPRYEAFNVDHYGPLPKNN